MRKINKLSTIILLFILLCMNNIFVCASNSNNLPSSRNKRDREFIAPSPITTVSRTNTSNSFQMKDFLFEVAKKNIRNGYPEIGVKFLEKAAIDGHKKAAFMATLVYRDGYYNIKPEPIKAIRYFNIATNLGNAQAAYCLGVMLEEIDKGAIKEDRALRYYIIASKLNHPIAIYNVAYYCYINGYYKYALILALKARACGDLDGSLIIKSANAIIQECTEQMNDYE